MTGKGEPSTKPQSSGKAKILHSHLSRKEVCAVFEVLSKEVPEMNMGRNSMIGQ